MAKSADAFRTISEVSEWLDTPAHVLRFWESKFKQLKPVKRAGGRRYYRPADMLLLGGIKKLLHTDGMTIKGVQKLLREYGVKNVSSHSQPLDDITAAAVVEANAVSDVISAPRTSVVTPSAETIEGFQRGEIDATPSHKVEYTEGAAGSSGDTTEDGGQTAAEGNIAEQVATGLEHGIDIPVEHAEPPPEPEPESGVENEPVTVPVEAAEQEQEPQAEAATETEQFAAEEEPSEATPEDETLPEMPVFARRAPEPEEAGAETVETTAPEIDSEVPAPKPQIVEVPADPDDDITAESGILTQITAIEPGISDVMADRLGQILARLRGAENGNVPRQDG